MMARVMGASNGSPTPTGVAHHDVALQLLHLIGRDDAIFERAEAGGDAIGHGALRQQALHRLCGTFNLPLRIHTQRHARVPRCAIGHGHYLLDGQVLSSSRVSISICCVMVRRSFLV